jgi:hypothetical protein
MLLQFGADVRSHAKQHYLSGRVLNVRTGALRKSVEVSKKGLPTRIVIGSDNTAGVVWENGKRPRKWLSPAFSDRLTIFEKDLSGRWQREVFRG